MVRVVATRRALSQAERKRARASLGRLNDLRIPASLRNRYAKAVNRFFSFLARRHKVLPNDMDLLDQELCEFVEETWEEGQPRSWCLECLSGIGKFEPSLQNQFPLARAFVETWKRHELPERAPPLSIDMLKALCTYALNKLHDVPLATIMLLTFHCMLRIGECVNLLVKDIVFGHSNAQLNLGLTKGGKRRGQSESVEATDPIVLQMLQSVLLPLEPGDRVFDYTYHMFQAKFGECLRAFHVQGYNFKTHSLRRGGTTFEFKAHGSYDIICERGRWQNVRTARLYIAEAVELTNNLSLSSASKTLITKYSEAFESLV
jgi:integrase